MSTDGTAENLVLSLETATRGGGLALLRGENVLSEWRGDESFSHSSGLLIEIEKLLRREQMTLAEIDLFAVALGPGSFTGLRVGVATIKGFCAALQKKAVGVPTFEAMIYDAPSNSHRVYAALPAGRSEIFVQFFENGAAVSQIQSYRFDVFKEILSNSGDVLVIAEPRIQEHLAHENMNRVVFATPSENLAVSVGRAAQRSGRDENFEKNELIINYGRSAEFGKSVAN